MSSAPAPNAPATVPATVPAGLTCSAVIDPTGYKNGPLTARQQIADLESMELVDGLVNLSDGTPSADDTIILDTAALDLENYSGNQLADDAAQFATDEQGFDPSGPVDVSYGQPVLNDILALIKDCPGAARLGITQLNGN
jgi:hypothetical protein